MPYTQSPFDISQLQQLLDTALMTVKVRPLECSAGVLTTALAGYTLKRLLASSAYPNLDGPIQKSLIYGHLNDLVLPYNIGFHDALQDTYGSVSKVYGPFGVLVKEADSVFRHKQYFYESSAQGAAQDAESSIHGKTHEDLLLTTVTEMFYMIADDMKRAMVKDMGGAHSKELDMLRWCSSSALELMGTAGIGHSFGILHGVESEYSRVVKTTSLAQIAPFRSLFPFVYRMGPSWLLAKLAGWAPSTIVREMKHIVDVQDRQRSTQAQEILLQKKEALKDPSKSKDMHDIMSVLLKANLEAREEDRLPEDQLLGQINTLIFAGHETTSGALSRTLHLLACHTTVQDRLRAELQEVPDTLSFDELNALPYLDALCREVLRLYPPAPYTERIALKDWVVPLKYPVKGKDGNPINEIHVRKGTKIYLALKEANRSKETWGDDADEFKPERWLQELPPSVADAKGPGVYSSMMTFSGGPRACIGFKFSILELKIVLSTLIKHFKFTPGSMEIDWLSCITMAPYPAGTKDVFGSGVSPSLPLIVTAL
ncbi:cytochrome P450 family protein [Rhizoctonia solani]|uniref:Cytochrome P450 family protein n=1 Tax=Rhizoctonia solani TaxID=456999 RepID=A0A8H8NYK0_9AGAM|nr:cytochrome P450 family protein [Rhizoctonia solani]QRW21127.1 cytochrome P450 family protein [Rhizoctonia solani]